MNLGDRIKELRKLRKLSQSELCKKIDMQPQNLSRIEKGKVMPRWGTILKIANALEVEPGKLMEKIDIHRAEELLIEFKNLQNEVEIKLSEQHNLNRLGYDHDNRIEKFFDGFLLDKVSLIERLKPNTKEISKRFNIPEEKIPNLNKDETTGKKTMNWYELLNFLNKAGINILDYLEEAISERPQLNIGNSWIVNKKKEIELLLNNLYIPSKNSLNNAIEYQSIEDIMKDETVTRAIKELVGDNKTVIMMNIDMDEIIWLLRVPVLPGMEFSKQDYIDMLYLYRKAHKQSKEEKKEGDNAQSH